MASLPFPAQLSAAIVAFTIECDNAAESRLAHRTTSHGITGPSRSVWLTSLAMWFNCLRDLDDGGPLTVSELAARARMETNLDGMRRWGYITIDGVGRVTREQPRPRAKRGSVLALTGRGEHAAGVWRLIPDEVEQRWRTRFGAADVDRLRAALTALVSRYERALPDFLPIGWINGVALEDGLSSDASEDASQPSLVSLLCRTLLAFALDYERGVKLSLAVQLDGLRVIDADGVPIRDLPRLTGVAKEAIAGIVKQLEQRGCLVVEPLAGATRGRQVRLTAERGARARSGGTRRVRGTLAQWSDRYGAAAVGAAADALEPVVGDGTRAGSPLFAGLEPPAGGWRAEVPSPQRLPWFPMVTHRGGYPDGS